MANSKHQIICPITDFASAKADCNVPDALFNACVAVVKER